MGKIMRNGIAYGGTGKAEESNNNWLKGKTINFLGDSITRGSWYLDGAWQGYMDNPYPAVIAKILNCTSNNYGVSGSKIVSNGESGFADRVNDLPPADVNVMFGGVNDLSSSNIGFENSTSIDTVYGALKYIAQTFLDKNPNSINVFISPMMSDLTDKKIKYPEIRQAINYVANMYGFIFIDASVEAPMMNPNIEALNNTWLNGNLVHPNPEYHQLLGKWLSNRLLHMESSSSIPSSNSILGTKVLPEIRSSGHTYLKIQWTKLSNTSELYLRFIGSYGGEFVISGNPYYDKSYNLSDPVMSIRAYTDNVHWNLNNPSYIDSVYVVHNAIYVKFNGACAMTPIVSGNVNTFDITMEWDDTWEGMTLDTDRELVLIKPTNYVYVGEISGETFKDAMKNLYDKVVRLYLEPNKPLIITSRYLGTDLYAIVTRNGDEYVYDITHSEGKYRMYYKRNNFVHIYKTTEEKL